MAKTNANRSRASRRRISAEVRSAAAGGRRQLWLANLVTLTAANELTVNHVQTALHNLNWNRRLARGGGLLVNSARL